MMLIMMLAMMVLMAVMMNIIQNDGGDNYDGEDGDRCGDGDGRT